MKANNITLNKEQEQIFKKVETSYENMFITGKAGTGKSELLKYIVKNTKKKCVVLAPTGIAALNVGGQTIHSFFRLKFGIQQIENLKYEDVDSIVADRINKIDTIIIDEVSMVGPDIIDAIDIICKKVRSALSSFGGIQLICFGDLFQLPPVITDNTAKEYLEKKYGVPLFYRAHAFENNNLLDDNSLKIYELTEVFRQKDEIFKDILNEVRIGNNSSNVLDILNKRVCDKDIDNTTITIATTNNITNIINKTKLEKLSSPEYTYKGTIKGDMPNSYLETDEVLHLKVGAQVIMLNNDTNGRWVNGSIGTVSYLSSKEIKVKIRNKEYSVEEYEWKRKEYYVQDGELVQIDIGTFTQYPLKLAWAITIHKSQGQTYESVVVDLGNGAFAEGQVYVALSRCVSLENLFLKKAIKATDIIANEDVINFMKNANIIKIEGEK